MPRPTRIQLPPVDVVGLRLVGVAGLQRLQRGEVARLGGGDRDEAAAKVLPVSGYTRISTELEFHVKRDAQNSSSRGVSGDAMDRVLLEQLVQYVACLGHEPVEKAA